MENILEISSAEEFRKWLTLNGEKEKSCYVKLKRGKPQKDDKLYYLDAVEVALCFGWIDSTLTKIGNETYQRFSPRAKNGYFSELNKERARRLEKLGLMTEAGRKVLPDLAIKNTIIPLDIEKQLKESGALDNFNAFPELYKRIRIYNLIFTKNKIKNGYEKAVENFIKKTKENKMYGEWNDYGRLLNY